MTTAARPYYVPAYAVRKENNDGSTSFVWRDKEGFSTVTVNCPPTAPIYFNPTNGVPIPPPGNNGDEVTCPHCGEVSNIGGLVGPTTDDCPKCGLRVLPVTKDNDYYLHCAYEMEAMGGSFASLIARAYYAADRDNKQRLITAFGHLFDRYAPTQGESK